MSDKPKFIVLEKSLIGNRLHEPGEEVTLPDGTLPADNLQATCDAGKALKEQYEASNLERVRRMQTTYHESAVGDANAFAAAVSKGVAEGVAQLLASGNFIPSGKGAKGAKATEPTT